MFNRKCEKISEFLSENFHCLVVKVSVYLNRHVFVINSYCFNDSGVLNTVLEIYVTV